MSMTLIVFLAFIGIITNCSIYLWKEHWWTDTDMFLIGLLACFIPYAIGLCLLIELASVIIFKAYDKVKIRQTTRGSSRVRQDDVI